MFVCGAGFVRVSATFFSVFFLNPNHFLKRKFRIRNKIGEKTVIFQRATYAIELTSTPRMYLSRLVEQMWCGCTEVVNDEGRKRN